MLSKVLIGVGFVYILVMFYFLSTIGNSTLRGNRKMDCELIKRPDVTALPNRPSDFGVRYYNIRQFGPGANGDAVIYNKSMLSKEEIQNMEDGWKTHDYNAFISDTISYHRIIRDYRPDMCRQLRYPANLPKVSVVVTFRDECLSVLLRTVYSILHNSPKELLEEIILVDDGSVLNDLQSKLDVHVRSIPIVKVIRKHKSAGLMMARQTGIDSSVAEYFITLDSHMECISGWMEPILYRLIQKPKNLLCSTLGGIDNDNFKVTHRLAAGEVFDFPFFGWNMEQQMGLYNRRYINSIHNATEPFFLGSVMGMMICMKKSWFLQLGGFDPGMTVWGSEQIELSMKVWRCGGEIEQVPCSYINHIYRRIVWDIRKAASVNKRRMLEVWVDEPYKQVVYDYSYRSFSNVNIGNISDRVQLKERNNCKPFQYFIDRVQEFAEIHVPVNQLKYGALRNVHTGMCLDEMWPDGPGLYRCHQEGGSQLFEYTQKREVRHLGHCLDPKKNDDVSFRPCDHFPDPQMKMWYYSDSDLTFKHIDSGKCLAAKTNVNELTMSNCSNSDTQKWMWQPLTRRT